MPRVVAEPTAADCTTRIEDVGADDALELRLVVRDRNPSPWDAQWDAAVRVEPGRTEARIETAPPRTGRWRLVAGDGPVPLDGTVLTVRDDPGSLGTPLGPERLTVANGEIAVVAAAAFQNVSFFADAPDGSIGWASANAGEILIPALGPGRHTVTVT